MYASLILAATAHLPVHPSVALLCRQAAKQEVKQVAEHKPPPVEGGKPEPPKPQQ